VPYQPGYPHSEISQLANGSLALRRPSEKGCPLDIRRVFGYLREGEMKIGIGLPNPVPGTPGQLFPDWARAAERRGFSGLVTIDRVNYPNYDSLTVLAAAAGATSRIELMTNILLAPLYPPVVLAKTAASIDQLSGGRFTLGLAPGGRPDDYEAVGKDFHRRGRDFDDALEVLHRAWAGGSVRPAGVEPVSEDTAESLATGPAPTRNGRVPVLIGGTSEKAIKRTVAWGAGWTGGGGTPEQSKATIKQVHAAWQEAGREGQPRMAALSYFSLGSEVETDSRAYLRHYYAFLGPYGEQIAEGALRSEAAIRDAVAQYEDAGVTELYFDPTVASLEQVDRLADIVL
jgi:alkanesulfonate monooxygenase SsuD/methylene tetrahydromethanopterin reductase-like flavin-dependent oxidoreductase (luciferase family)